MTEEAVKLDSEKPRYDLIPPDSLDFLAKVYTMGAVKYEAHNWCKGMAWHRIFAAIMRHLWAFWRGEDLDKESGLPHPIHAAWGCFTLVAYWNRKLGTDDRYKQNTEKEGELNTNV